MDAVSSFIWPHISFSAILRWMISTGTWARLPISIASATDSNTPRPSVRMCVKVDEAGGDHKSGHGCSARGALPRQLAHGCDFALSNAAVAQNAGIPGAIDNAHAANQKIKILSQSILSRDDSPQTEPQNSE